MRALSPACHGQGVGIRPIRLERQARARRGRSRMRHPRAGRRGRRVERATPPSTGRPLQFGRSHSTAGPRSWPVEPQGRRHLTLGCPNQAGTSADVLRAATTATCRWAAARVSGLGLAVLTARPWSPAPTPCEHRPPAPTRPRPAAKPAGSGVSMSCDMTMVPPAGFEPAPPPPEGGNTDLGGPGPSLQTRLTSTCECHEVSAGAIHHPLVRG